MSKTVKTVVLVADDEPSTRALVAGHLRSKGYQVYEASDGDEAWTLAHEHLPHVVVLDVMMPGMTGWEVCRKIREAVSLAHTGVVMLTGIGENLNEMTSPLYGADAYLDKPFEFSKLDRKIQETLARRRPRSSADFVAGIAGAGKTPHVMPPKPAAKPAAKKAVAKPAAKKAVAKPAAKKAAAKPSAKKTTAKKTAAKRKAVKKAVGKKTKKKTAKRSAKKSPKAAKKTAKRGAKAAKKAAKRSATKGAKAGVRKTAKRGAAKRGAVKKAAKKTAKRGAAKKTAKRGAAKRRAKKA